ncbi:MAG: GatB/YqeY domain-containing protein [Chloroflexi bacterium]|nr:GatB/YqeY domain-containing protein [Chloroflexota bacterium]
MGLRQQLQNDLKDALRAHDKHRKSVIRMCLAKIVNAKVEHGGELDDAGVVVVLRRKPTATPRSTNCGKLTSC